MPLSLTEIKELSEVLAVLTKAQFEALKASGYYNMSRHEANAYDRRRERIAEISALLAKSKKAA